MFFERKNAAKRNVATRQPARDVGQGLQDAFELELLLHISVGGFTLVGVRSTTASAWKERCSDMAPFYTADREESDT